MKKICAWCRADLGEVLGACTDVVTHGICKTCKELVLAQCTGAVTNYLDRFDAPILVVGPDGCVQTANKHARALLHKDFGELTGFRGGEVFECKHALGGGCGKDEHCDDCGVRRAVRATMESGITSVRQQTYLDQINRTLRLLITTQKLGKIVLLRIDEAVSDL